jgi:hypothetical protein
MERVLLYSSPVKLSKQQGSEKIHMLYITVVKEQRWDKTSSCLC